VIGAAFTKEQDFFAQRNITYMDTAVTLNEPLLLKQRLFTAFNEQLGMTEDENNFAVDEAFAALEHFDEHMQEKGRLILEVIAEDNRIAILMTGRPYHNDPGMNHGVLEEYQSMGYPILSMRSIPKDKEFLAPFFADDLKRGYIDSPLEIQDIWPENYSVNSVQKVWATKFAARHPNVAVLDLSSFKCGHDAPTYGLVDRMMSVSGSPFSALHDIDANKPSGSIKIRVKTYGYTLKLAEEKLEDAARQKNSFELLQLNKRLELLAAAPAKIQQDALFIAERNKCLARKAELEQHNHHPVVEAYTPQFANNPNLVTSNLIAAVELD
jgi:predicted nucleotide-binding protein (sugar kinase/HSP70/actin superfamily)